MSEERGGTEKRESAYRTIGEVAEELDLPAHVLRFWETRFKDIDPVKRAGGRRLYRARDVELVRAIRHLLYGEGYTIKGVQRILKEQGPRAVVEAALARARRPAPCAAPAPPEGPVLAEQTPDPEEPAPAVPPRPLTGDGERRLRQALAELAEASRLLKLLR